MLVGGDFGRDGRAPRRRALGTFDRVCIGVLAACPLAAAVRLAGELLS